MASYYIDTYEYDEYYDKWIFEKTYRVDPRWIIYIDMDTGAHSKRYGDICKMQIKKEGFYYESWINEDDARFLLSEM
jgi:hypothetical protein